MKSNKVWFCGFVVAFLVICFTASTTRAQGLSGWVGRWFKITYNSKGWDTENTGEDYYIRAQSDKVTPYLEITVWDTTDKSDPFLGCSAYHQEDGNVVQSLIDLHYVGGPDLDFLFLGFFVDTQHHEQFTGRITGKESGGILKSATFKTTGGIYWDKGTFDIPSGKAGGFTITGSLISESKLPSWVPKITP
jgi:hypothetical protein